MTISNRLNEAMSAGDGRKKISQSELSRRSGVPQPTIARILKGDGKRGPETATLVALARALGVEFMWLQQGTEPKYLGGTAAPARPVVSPTDANMEFKRHWLNADESDHLADYRSLTTTNRKRVRSIVTGMERDDVAGEVTDKL